MKINETQLKEIIKNVINESMKKVLREEISDDDYLDLKQIIMKSFSNLNEEEKQHVLAMVRNETWYVVYVIEEILQGR